MAKNTANNVNVDLSAFEVDGSVLAFLQGRKIDSAFPVRACNAQQGRRTVIATESEGTRIKKDTANSAVTVSLSADKNVVTMFIEWAEAEKGWVARETKKAAKKGCALTVVDFPSAEVGEWLQNPKWRIARRGQKTETQKTETPAEVTA